MGVEIRTFRRQPDRSDTAALQNLTEDAGEERISVVNEMAGGPEETVDGVSQIAGHLLHPRTARVRVDPGDVHAVGLKLDHEADDVPPETGQREYFHREQICGGQAFPVRL